MRPDVDWLIIGGGVHGTHLSKVLLCLGNVPRNRLRVLDPFEPPLHRWRIRTGSIGMRHLRSTAVHHIDVDPFGLHRFARRGRGRKLACWTAPYQRPGLEFFNAHADHVVEQAKLLELREQAWARSLTVCDRFVRVETDRGPMTARQVVLALGDAGLFWPAWARALQSQGRKGQIQHVFEDDFQKGSSEKSQSIVVVGAGISAAQLAVQLADEGHQVHVVGRHPVKVHTFDANPGWLGPKNLTRFHTETDPDRRRMMIDKARNRGSMPRDVKLRFDRAVQSGVVEHRVDEVLHAEPILQSHQAPRIELQLREGRIECDRVVLATGFRTERPGGELVDALVQNYALECAQCGYPVIDRHLCWHPRISVMGPLAELEIGPAARNIAGARMAATRIIEHASKM